MTVVLTECDPPLRPTPPSISSSHSKYTQKRPIGMKRILISQDSTGEGCLRAVLETLFSCGYKQEETTGLLMLSINTDERSLHA